MKQTLTLILKIGDLVLEKLEDDIPTIEEFSMPLQLSRTRNNTWIRIRKHKQYQKILKKLDNNAPRWKLGQIEDLVCDFVYNIARNFTKYEIYPESNIDMSEAREFIQREAPILAEDLLRKSRFEIIAPLFCFEMKSTTFRLGKHAIIRRARYSEKRRYRVSRLYSNFLGFGIDIEYVLELFTQSKDIRAFKELTDSTFELAGDITIALRLVCGGTVGLSFIHFISPPSFGNLSESGRKKVHVLPPPPLVVSRAIRPGLSVTYLKSEDFHKVETTLNWIKSLDVKTSDFIWRAIKRFGTAINSGMEKLGLDDYVIDMIVALECLFQGIKNEGHARAAAFVSTNQETRETIEKELLRCWRTRDVFVHGGWNRAEKQLGETPSERLELLGNVVRSSLLLSIAHKPKNRGSFLDKIDHHRTLSECKVGIHEGLHDWLLDLSLIELTSDVSKKENSQGKS
jgi:hypothetical protein